MLNYKIYLLVILVLQNFTIPLQAENKAKGGLGRKIMRPTLVAKAKIHSFTDPAKPFTNI